jgi:hypothetical protein
MISSVACEGMRLLRPEPIDDLGVGTRIRIRLFIDGSELCLPGTVAWVLSKETGETHVGVSLALELADALSRQVWARWVVAQSDKKPVPARAGRAGGHNRVHVTPSALRRAASDH